MKIYAESLDAIARIPEPGERAHQHLSTVCSLFHHGFPESVPMLLSESCNLVRALSDLRQKLFLLRKVGVLFAEMGLFSEVFSIAEDIDLLLLEESTLQRSGWKQDVEDHKDALFRALGAKLFSFGKNEESFAVLDRILDFDEYENAVLDIFESPASLDCKSELLQRIESPESTVQALIRIAAHEKKRGLRGDFLRTVHEARKMILTEIGVPDHRDSLLKKLLEFFTEEQNGEENRSFMGYCEEIIGEIRNPIMQIESRLSYAKRVFQIGNEQAAFSLLDSAISSLKEIGNSPENMHSKAILCRAVGSVCALFDKTEQSRSFYREALRLVESETNSFFKMRFFEQTAQSLAEIGERSAAGKLHQKAFFLAREDGDVHLRSFYLKGIAESMLLDHFYEESLEVLESIADFENGGKMEGPKLNREIRSHLLHQHSLALSRRAEILKQESELNADCVEPLLEESLNLAREIDDPILRADSLRKIAEVVNGSTTLPLQSSQSPTESSPEHVHT